MIAINLKIADSLLVERITGRLACKTCNQIYHRTYSPPEKKGMCDLCQGTLYQRDDDKEEILLKRLEAYHEQTSPLLAYYSAKPNVLVEIEAANSREKVFQSVLDVLGTAVLSNR